MQSTALPIPLTPIAGTDPENRSFQASLFSAWLIQQNASASTIRHYLRACGRWIDILDQSQVAAPIAWLQWTAPDAEKRLTGFAIRKYQQFASEVLGEVAAYGVPRKLPASSRPDPHPVERADIRKMRLAARTCFRDAHTSYVVRVFLATVDELALRRTEAFFDWDDVRFETAEIRIHGKGGDIRRLPLSSRLVGLLCWWKARSPLTPWTDLTGCSLKPDTMYRRYKRLARAIGAPDSRLHWLRHGRLTALAATPGGFDPVNLCAISGHRQINSLKHYCKPQMSRLRELMHDSFAASSRKG
jgi:integrase